MNPDNTEQDSNYDRQVTIMGLMRGFCCLLPLSIGVLLLMTTNSPSEPPSQQMFIDRETHFSPVVLSVLTEPHPVRGSDGLVHLVYELHLTNATNFSVQIESLEVLSGAIPETGLALFSREDIPTIMQGLVSKTPTDRLEAGEGAIIFIHFTMKKPAAHFVTLAHRLTISGDFPPEFIQFLGLADSKKGIVAIGGVTNIYGTPPIVIGPPLEGNGWIAADGCCTAKRHIRAIMPINGKLRVAQRFAIDWELMDSERRIFVGNPSDVQSYFAYGQKVLAVADATVIRAVDQYEDQVPGKQPTGMTLAEVDGNHIVLDLGNDRFAYYAHFQPGSVKAHGVKVGDRVCRGQVLGLVGNSGNTIAPHLHFHVMSSPSTIGSNGLPYVIEDFQILGRIPTTEAFDRAEKEGTPLAIQEVDNPGTHSDELPLDLSVVDFPLEQKCKRFAGETK